jgi:hypothetical protein
MYHRRAKLLPDLLADPFGEMIAMRATQQRRLLGGHFRFESNSHQLMRLVDAAYAGMPPHRFRAPAPQLRVRLLLLSGERHRSRSEPPPLAMLSGPGFLGGATDASNAVIMSARERTALVLVSPQMLRFGYHTRYELIEFAVFTLAARTQGLVPLHAACVGRGGRGVLLMGPSGAGKSTVALLSLLRGLDFLSEDSVFVDPDSMLATGVANFLHVRADSLRWIERESQAAAIRKSPVIRRRSGVKKYELDLRHADYRLAASPLKINAIVFLSTKAAGKDPLLRPLLRPEMSARLTAAQAYAANQPEWRRFSRQFPHLEAYELRRGAHPGEAVDVLRDLLERGRE